MGSLLFFSPLTKISKCRRLLPYGAARKPLNLFSSLFAIQVNSPLSLFQRDVHLNTLNMKNLQIARARYDSGGSFSPSWRDGLKFAESIIEIKIARGFCHVRGRVCVRMLFTLSRIMLIQSSADYIDSTRRPSTIALVGPAGPESISRSSCRRVRAH